MFETLLLYADLGEAPEYISGDLTDVGWKPQLDNTFYNNGNVAPTQGNPSNLNNDIYIETTGTDPNNLNSAFSQQVLSGSQSIQALSSNTYDGYSQHGEWYSL
jgi:hypothetical protein